MGKSRSSIEGGGKGGGGRSRDKRAGLMEGMMGGSPTKDEIARVIVSVPEIISTSKSEENESAPIAASEVTPASEPVEPEKETDAEIVPPESPPTPAVVKKSKPRAKRAARATTKPDAKPQESEKFDANAIGARVQDAYLAYVKTLQESGIEPESMSPESWETAYKAIDTAKDLARQYKKAPDAETRAAIGERLRRLAESVESGKIAKMLDKEALRSDARRRAAVKIPARNKLSARETRQVISDALDKLPPSSEASTALSPQPEEPTSPTVEKKIEAKNPWETYGVQLSDMENRIKAAYPEWKDVPADVLEKYYTLTREQLGNIERKDSVMQEATAADVAEFIETLSGTPAMPSAPPASQEREADIDTDKEIDRNSFQAAQYADGLEKERSQAQAEMDALSADTPALKLEKEPVAEPVAITQSELEKEQLPPLPGAGEPMPAEFRKNRERPNFGRRLDQTLIPTLTDVVEPDPTTQPTTPEQKPVSMRGRGVKVELRDDGMEYVVPSGNEATPKEWRERLRSLLGGAKEKLEWWKSSEEGLIRSSEELNAEAERIGGGEKLFRALGEQYNKLGWKSKLVIGTGLGIGYGAALSAVSLPAILGCIFAIGVQRTAGLSTMYLKYEKTRPYGDRNQKGFWNWNGPRERAMRKSILYTAAMTTGMMYVAKEVSDHDVVNRTKEWLGEMMDKLVGNHPEAGAVATAPNVFPPHSAPAHEAAAPIATPTEAPPPAHMDLPKDVVDSNGATAVPPVAHEMPSITVHATNGKGYEYMLKRMWDGIHDKGLNPDDYAKDSDIYKLLTADKASIDKVVHDMASTEHGHGFYNPDGTNALIGKDDMLAFNTEGQVVRITPDGVASVDAPVGGPTTPPYHPETGHAWQERIVPDDTTPAGVADRELGAAVGETDTSPAGETLPSHAPEASVPEPTHTAVETQPSVGEQIESAVHDIDHGHVFLQNDGLNIAYNADFEKAFNAAQEFAKNNPGQSVFLQAERPVLVNGEQKPWVMEIKWEKKWFLPGRMVIVNPTGPSDMSQIRTIDIKNFTKLLDK